jgi:hypothetical protein
MRIHMKEVGTMDEIEFPQSVCINSQPHGPHRIAGTWRTECPGYTPQPELSEPFYTPAAGDAGQYNEHGQPTGYVHRSAG